MRPTFILHSKGAKVPTDLLGMTAVRYPEALTAADMRAVNQKLRKAIESASGRRSRPRERAGLGHAESFGMRHHGAGRAISRIAARKGPFTLF